MNRSLVIGRRQFLLGLAGFGTSYLLPNIPMPAEQVAPFSFAFVSDCHLVTGVPDSFKLTQESQLFLQNAVKQINALNPDFVIFGGDQVDCVGEEEANWQLFIDIVQSLKCPWFFILGERDVWGERPIDKLKTYGRDWKGKGLVGDKSYWSQDVLPKVHLIGLDTSLASSTVGELSSEQLSWLQQDLDGHNQDFIIVTSHHPLLPPAPFDGGPPWDDYVVRQGANAREILNSSNGVRLALSGHVYTSKIEREKDIWYVSCPGLDVFPCAFRYFLVDQHGITVETYQIDYPALVKKARNSLASSTLAFHYDSQRPNSFLDIAQGTREDQNARLPLLSGQPLEAIKRRNLPTSEPPRSRFGWKKKHKRTEKEEDPTTKTKTTIPGHRKVEEAVDKKELGSDSISTSANSTSESKGNSDNSKSQTQDGAQ